MRSDAWGDPSDKTENRSHPGHIENELRIRHMEQRIAEDHGPLQPGRPYEHRLYRR